MTTAVLIHGGWQSAACWDLVRAELSKDGIASVAPQLPMTSTLDVDAAVVRETLDGLGDDAVVVAHSWGGSPVTLGASGAPNLQARHLPGRDHDRRQAGPPWSTCACCRR